MRERRLRARGFGFLLVGALLAGCVSGRPVASDATPAGQLALYEQAIRDAAVYSSQVAVRLTPVTSDPATVVAWTHADLKPGPATLTGDFWVTLVPQVAERCSRFERDKLALRLQELLGLKPGAEDGATRKFVVLKVRDADLFRPCTDPDPKTAGPCTQLLPSCASGEYCKWIADHLLSSYQVPDGFPWTHLGYTFDWNPATPRFGPSEYVIRGGSDVEVLEVVPTADYCAPAAP